MVEVRPEVRVESLEQESPLKGKHIVIIGASSGLGQAISEQLTKEGSHLFLMSRNIQEVPVPQGSVPIFCDLTDVPTIIEAFKEVDRRAPQIDFVLNVAGVGLIKGLGETTDRDIHTVIDTDLVGAIFSSREAYRRMKRQQSGHIINVSSTTGLMGKPQEAVYSAAKAGIRGFTQGLRAEGEQYGVTVSAVFPGGMNSPRFWQIDPERNIEAFMNPSDVAKTIIQHMKHPEGAELVIRRS